MKRLCNVLSGLVGLLVLAALVVGAGMLLRAVRPPSEAAGPPLPIVRATPTVALNATVPQREQPLVVPSLVPEPAGEAAVDAPWFLVYGGEAPPEMAQVPHQWVPHILPLDEKGNPLGEPKPVIPRLPEDAPADWVCDGAIEPSPDGRYAIALPPMWAIPACIIDLHTAQAWSILQGDAAQWGIDWALWYPDGQRLVVGANHQIWLVDVPGGERTALLDLKALSLWSDNVRRVAILADGDIVLAARTSPIQELDTIWVVDADSGKAEKLREDVYFESISFDRRTIYYRDGGMLKATDGRGKEIAPDGRLVEAQDIAMGSPLWSPDGTRFVFCARERPLEKGQEDDESTGVNIYLKSTTGQLQVLSRDSIYPAWSPDGSMIAFERRPEGRLVREIWIANADGGSLRQVTNDGRNKGGLWWLGGQR